MAFQCGMTYSEMYSNNPPTLSQIIEYCNAISENRMMLMEMWAKTCHVISIAAVGFGLKKPIEQEKFYKRPEKKKSVIKGTATKFLTTFEDYMRSLNGRK